MPSVCLHFHVHQPRWLRHYTFFDINHDHVYEDAERNLHILNKLSEKCYIPANNIMLKLIKKYKGDFRIAISVTGMLLDQFEKLRSDVLDGFKRIADTGCAEFVNETYYHSLAFLFSAREFKEQVMLHKKKIKALFGQTPKAFRHAELMYNGNLTRIIEKMGYNVILARGADKILGRRSPGRVYQQAGCKKLRLLFRNHRLSDDIAVRFSDSKWSEYPLTADKYAHWIHHTNDTGDNVVNLFVDYETLGEHQKKETGIFAFIRELPREILKHADFKFQTPSEIVDEYEPAAQLDLTNLISQADMERDLSAWLGNTLQKDAINTLYGMESKVRSRKDGRLLNTWRMLQASDHFYYMHTGSPADGDGHKDFNPYGSPYDAYINYMNIIDDFSGFIGKKKRSVINGKTK
ncbi:MAG TPA: glycoside hydrolase family 57 protein [Syntrophales bacterium]|nr:glycoside hydrolase family 57 protein [Syntrophales bacterium]